LNEVVTETGFKKGIAKGISSLKQRFDMTLLRKTYRTAE